MHLLYLLPHSLNKSPYKGKHEKWLTRAPICVSALSMKAIALCYIVLTHNCMFCIILRVLPVYDGGECKTFQSYGITSEMKKNKICNILETIKYFFFLSIRLQKKILFLCFYFFNYKFRVNQGLVIKALNISKISVKFII